MMNYIVEFQKRNQYDCDGNSKPFAIAKCFDENTTLKEIVNWVINECGWFIDDYNILTNPQILGITAKKEGGEL